jgi:DNA recombination protein RmuC
MLITVLAAIVAFTLGACIITVVSSRRSSAVSARLAAAEAELSAGRTASSALQSQLAAGAAELKMAVAEKAQANQEVARLGEQLKQQELGFAEKLSLHEQQAHEKIALLTGIRDELSRDFKVVAGELMEEKSQRFTKLNQDNMSQLLTPLSEKIKDFQQKVEHVYETESKDRSALSEQVRLLMEQTQQISGEAGRLTRALTTSSKTQGDLGEMILEKILESSGLRKGEEYFAQSSFSDAQDGDARQSRPDVIVTLPESKHLIIDSKVSLTAYNEYVNAEDDELRRLALGRHLDSVRRHIKGLADKNYHALHQLQSIDFVCMFVPIEGAFLAAIAGDPELWESSYERNVLLVSPSTLLFVVRTVAHLWRQERQKQNVQEIVSRGAELYDKLSLFVDEMKKVGDRLDQAQVSYTTACNRLYRGNGNVIRQAEMLKELGVKPKKALPAELVETSAETEPLLPEQAGAAGAV